MALEHLSEIRFAQPSVDALADLDADCFRNARRAAEPSREKDLAEAALAQQAIDPVRDFRLGADDRLIAHQERRCAFPPRPWDCCRARGGGGRMNQSARPR